MERRAKLYGALSEAQLEATHMADENEYHEEELEQHDLEEGEYEYDEYMQWDGEAEEENVEQPSNNHVIIREPPPQGGQYAEDEYGEFVEFTNEEDAQKYLAKMHAGGMIVGEEELIEEETEAGPSQNQYIHEEHGEQEEQEELHDSGHNTALFQLFDPPGRRRATTHECEVCGVFLKHPSKIAAHMRTHTGEKPFQCDVCGRSFSQRTPWRMHMKRHTQDLPFLCSSGCGKAFPNASQRNAHDLRHLGRPRMGPARPHLKPQKKLIVNDPEADMRQAIMDERRGPPVVESPLIELTEDAHKRIDEVINAVAENRQVVQFPVTKAPPPPRAPPAVVVRRVSSRRAPPIVAECHICGLLLKHPSKIQAHMRTHQGVKPYSCKLCGMNVATFYALRIHHKRRHTQGDRPFACTWDCGRRFVSVSARNEHERIVHAGIKRYVCNVGGCCRLFSRRNHLIGHRMKDHPGIAHVDEYDDPVDLDYDEIRELMVDEGEEERHHLEEQEEEEEEERRMMEEEVVEESVDGHIMDDGDDGREDERRGEGRDEDGGEDEEVEVVEEEEVDISDNVYRLAMNPPRLIPVQKMEKREDRSYHPSPPSAPSPPHIYHRTKEEPSHNYHRVKEETQVPILVPRIHKMPKMKIPAIVRRRGNGMQ